MLLKSLTRKIEKKYPLNLAEDWDNVGLIVGDFDMDVKKVLVSLEANEDVIDEAISKNIDLIVTHHPFIFGKINKINSGDLKGRLIQKLIKNDISLYSMHTNFDIAFDGLNDYFMEIMEFGNSKVLDKLDKSMTLESLSRKIKEKLNMKHIRVVGNLSTDITKVAVVTGAGSEFVKKAKRQGAEVLITGDVKYHEAQDALDIGMCIVDCGHFDTEDIFKNVMKRFLDEFSEIEVIKSNVYLNPFSTI